MRAARRALAGILLVATACSYSPNPESGTLMCSVVGGWLPEGYGCTDGLCYKDGEVDESRARGSSSATGYSATRPRR